MTNQETPGETIARLRHAKGWSVYRLAIKAKVNRAQLGRIERGERSMSFQTALKIAAALGASLAAFDGAKP